MSTFRGGLKEYPLISLDEFSGNNFLSTVFFLSHCHSDHMNGLSYDKFFYRLRERNFCKIFMSKISRALLVNDVKYERLSPYLQVLDIESPTTVVVPDDNGKQSYSVLVTLLSAGHCPGSVMFFFESGNGNVLYTGDFRLEVGSTRRFKHLRYDSGRLKPITSVYLDTTFCDPKSFSLPSREQCLDAICDLVHSWVVEGSNNIIHLWCSANLGYEYVFMSLYNKFGYKTHVKEAKYCQYKDIEEIKDAVTTVATEAKIHPCWKDWNNRLRNFSIPCGYKTLDGQPVHVRSIKLSAFFYARDINISNIVRQFKGEESFQACFSTHSSFSEIQDMISYLQPLNVYANVVPNETTEAEVLQGILPLLKHPRFVQEEFQMPALGTLVTTAKSESGESVDFDSGSLNFDDAINVNRKVSNSNLAKAAEIAYDRKTLHSESLAAVNLDMPINVDCRKEHDGRPVELSPNNRMERNLTVSTDFPTWKYSSFSDSDSTCEILNEISNGFSSSSGKDSQEEKVTDNASYKDLEKSKLPNSSIQNSRHCRLYKPSENEEFAKSPSPNFVNMNGRTQSHCVESKLPFYDRALSPASPLSPVHLNSDSKDCKAFAKFPTVIYNANLSEEESDSQESPSLLEYPLKTIKKSPESSSSGKEAETVVIDLTLENSSEELYVIDSSSDATNANCNLAKKAKICDNNYV